MRSSRSVRLVTAASLLPLLVALGTGLPSHHHAEDTPRGGELRLISADHHSHPTKLVEQDVRLHSTGPQVAVTHAVVVDLQAPVEVPTAPIHRTVLRPRERAPPPGAPRAPPVWI